MSDLIDREQALKEIFNRYSSAYEWCLENGISGKEMTMALTSYAICHVAIKRMPSAKPPPETCWGCNCQKMEKAIRGKWVQVNHNERECSLCGNRELWMNAAVYEFCPHCGSKMEVTE